MEFLELRELLDCPIRFTRGIGRMDRDLVLSG
jgi:hypothetical protein